MENEVLTATQTLSISILTASIPVLLGVLLYGRQKSSDRKHELLRERREAYSAFLKSCPRPNDAYRTDGELNDLLFRSMQEGNGPLLMYCSQSVTEALGRYFSLFSEVSEILDENSETLHPEYMRLAKAHNDLILEMRRDALGGSITGYYGKRRF